jgi:ADP-ribose pyrophosphatase
MGKVVIEQQRVLLNDFFQVEEAVLRYERFDGQMSEPVRRLCLERGDSAAAILWDREARQVILTNQFKYPTLQKDGGWIIELVAGSIDRDEEPLAAMHREIQEETGYTVHELTQLATFYVTPGGSSERIILFYAEVTQADHTSAGGGLVEEGEDIQLVRWTLDELSAAIADGGIRDAKTLIGGLWLQAHQGRLV